MLQEAERSIQDTHIGVRSREMAKRVRKNSYMSTIFERDAAPPRYWRSGRESRVLRRHGARCDDAVGPRRTSVSSCSRRSPALSLVLTVSRGGRGREKWFQSWTSNAAAVTKIRIFESPRDNSRTDKQCHTHAPMDVRVMAVRVIIEIPSTLRTGHDAGCCLFVKLVQRADIPRLRTSRLRTLPTIMHQSCKCYNYNSFAEENF